MTAASLHTALRAVGLAKDVRPEAFALLVQEARESAGEDDDWLVLHVLSQLYGFETDDPNAAARCVRDRLLVFNEFHETDLDAFTSRLRAFAGALDIEAALAFAPRGDDLPYEAIEDLAEALTTALADRAQRVHVFGVDSDVAVLVRDAIPPEAPPIIRPTE